MYSIENRTFNKQINNSINLYTIVDIFSLQFHFLYKFINLLIEKCNQR